MSTDTTTLEPMTLTRTELDFVRGLVARWLVDNPHAPLPFRIAAKGVLRRLPIPKAEPNRVRTKGT